ncbi:mechanosensitive ion channel family protein [Shimia aestuarii]|uniref:Small-conductance mechanosensitive channel n=1 Tax=Shimia aestuarii TaxID=254406 RepID=A0A1I4PE40_9RHOB|nr:mechanosensitive ion channel family protein [Shimia aestuarii]SFM26008.1 Small-conductance mechanosensitive channel [Shimia aestuarii]
MSALVKKVIGLIIAAFLLATPLAAQETTNTDPQVDPATMTPEAIDAMVARMSDDEVRAFLLERLDAVAMQSQAPEEVVTLSDKVANLWGAFTTPLLQTLQKLPDTLRFVGVAISNQIDKASNSGGLLLWIGLIALVLAVGFAVEYAVRAFLMRRVRQKANPNGEESLRDAVQFLFRRFVREILGLIVFYVVIRALGRSLLSPEMLLFAAPLVGYLIWMPRLAAAASRFLLAPHRPDLRLVSIDDHWARFLHRNIVGVVFLGGLTIYSVTFLATNGVPPGSTRLGYMLDSALYIYIILIALTARDGLRAMMLGSDPDTTRFDRRVADAYPIFAIVVAASTWALVTTLIGLGTIKPLLQGAHYTTMFLLLAAPVVDTAIRGLVRHLVPPMAGEGPAAEAAYLSTKRSYVRIGRVIAVGIIFSLIARAWDMSVAELLMGGAGIADNLFSFLMTVVVGYVAYEAVSLWINSRLAAEMTALGMSQEDADAEMGGASGSRLSTVLPLMLLTARATIIVVFGLLAIGNLGIDITPLLAGAGVLGLAIGFGAQKLVTDVVSGVFFLIDDAFRVGDYVEIDGTMGAVEKISIRSMQLRHHRGPVHTIPYGEIPKLTNYSRDWVIMKLKFTVPFDTNPNQIKKIFKKIGQEMMEDPLFKDDFLQPFKSQGVFDIDDVGMVIRGKFMAKPGKQFMIRKEIYNKVKAAFAEAGIDFARREVRVAIPGLEHHEDMSEEEKAAITAAAAGAAADAAQQQDQAPSSAPKGPD